MRRYFAYLSGGLIVLAVGGAEVAAESYQPDSNVTRGIYARLDSALGSSVWQAWGSGFTFADDQAHGGRSCVRCVGRADESGQGVRQRIELNQTEPRPIKIAGWSRSDGVSGESNYRYSLYVDLAFADGESWPMKLAVFDTGSHDWQYRETVVTPPKPLRSAAFHAFIRETDGSVWFDDLFFGEVDGKNLLRCPGFEKECRRDASGRQELFESLKSLHCNALHGYLSGTLATWEQPPSATSELGQFLDATRERGIGVWLTQGLGPLPIRDADDANFPQYYCVNGPWGQRWSEILAKAARYPFAGLSMVPDEYNCNNGHLQRSYEKHSDPRVRDFYAKLGTYCDCPVCRRKFESKYGESFPERLPSVLPAADERHRKWLQFRYDSTTDWLRRSCRLVKQANPEIRTDSLICVTPICSDFWYGPGIAWDRLGYQAGLEYATTDPYIQLHNYLGDSTHWYVTETTEHLAAAGPERRCGIVLEASRLRREHREIDPVEVYGSALSAVWHGADELAWWHHSHVTGSSGTTERDEQSRACVRGVYSLLEKIDPWLESVTPQAGVALLFSRASCDAWRLHVQAKDSKPPFDTRGISDPRHASLVQKELLYLLLRTGVPTTLYYLDSVQKQELADHRTIVVPFPLAVSGAQASLLKELARDGRRVVVFDRDGPLDENGGLHPHPVLADLIGEGRSDGGPNENAIGAGKIVYLPPTALAGLVTDRDNEKRTRLERILPSALDAKTARMILDIITDRGSSSLPCPLMSGRLPEGDDVELCLSTNANRDRLLLAINWSGGPRSVTLPKGRGFDESPGEAYLLGPSGQWRPWQGALQPNLRLEAQEALVALWRE